MNPLKTIYLKSWTIVLCVRAIEFRVNHGCVDGSGSFEVAVRTKAWAPARGEQGGQALTLEKIRVGMAHPGNLSRG